MGRIEALEKLRTRYEKKLSRKDLRQLCQKKISRVEEKNPNLSDGEVATLVFLVDEALYSDGTLNETITNQIEGKGYEVAGGARRGNSYEIYIKRR